MIRVCFERNFRYLVVYGPFLYRPTGFLATLFAFSDSTRACSFPRGILENLKFGHCGDLLPGVRCFHSSARLLWHLPSHILTQ
jgi:hypothetical protein